MRNEPKIGLVTVLYNGIEVLEGFFESLGKQTYKNYILYVIDNSPDDIALNEAKRLSSEFKINSVFIKNNDNFGVAKGNNQGIKQGLEDECEYVLLLNNDIEFPENTIGDMVNYTIEHKEQILVPKIYYHGTNKLWMAGGHISKWKGITPHRGFEEEDIGQYDTIEYVDYAPTCFMLIDKNVFSEVGFMDESYFVYYDDSDFIWRANKKGFKVLYYPKVAIEHKVSFSTGGAESPFTIYYFTRNRIYFIYKNFNSINKLISLIYFSISRVFKLFIYSKEQKSMMFTGIKDSIQIL